VRLPAAFNGIFGFKPSFGRAPIYPPYRGRVVGPLTRNVTDAALRMAVLSKYKPDARDYTALPYQEIDWIGSLRGDVKGRNSVSCSRLVSASSRRRRCARQSRRKAFARAGAIVEPVAPFFTRGMLDGLDIFWAAGSRCSRSPPSGQRHRLLYL
jgi:aspartyl-tRNA(Asn)/glutamyl-tRNA(Gln) amidotransferase subunit A